MLGILQKSGLREPTRCLDCSHLLQLETSKLALEKAVDLSGGGGHVR
jgi:hypothetical protein